MHHLIRALLLFTQLALSQTLYQTLSDAGAAQFAFLIQSDPELAALYESGEVLTIYAPSDASPHWSKRQAASPEDRQRSRLHGIGRETSIRVARTWPSLTLPTKDNSGNLGGRNQTVVAEAPARPTNSTANSRRVAARDPTALPSLYRVVSGLGNSVNVIQADIPYESANGIININIVDDFFTIPTSLSRTSEETGQTTFASLASRTNQSTTLDSLPFTTYFVPSNEAFDNAGLSSPGPGTANLLGGHVIPNFAGYLPDLTDGLVLADRNGNNVTIHVRDEQVFVGNARVISSNQILENGVAHVIDQVLTVAPAPVPGSFAAPNSKAIWPTVASLILFASLMAV